MGESRRARGTASYPKLGWPTWVHDAQGHREEGSRKGKGGLGHRERRRSSVRLAGAAARFDAVPARAHVSGGVRMRSRHRAARVEHQRAPALRAHQASRSHRTVIGRCGFAFAWRGTCKFIECHVSWPLSSTAALWRRSRGQCGPAMPQPCPGHRAGYVIAAPNLPVTPRA